MREQSSDLALIGIMMSAPNFWAWVKARPAKACPEMPVGKPTEFSIRALAPAWPPKARESNTATDRPSEAA